MVLTTFIVVDDAISAVAVAGVVVRIYNEAGSVLITQGTTDSAGELALLLTDATTYWVRFYKQGYAFDSLLTVAVDSLAASNTFDVTAEDLTAYPTATDANLCRVSGTTVNAAAALSEGVTIFFANTGNPRVVGGRTMLPGKVYVTSDEDGYVELDLVRNGIYEAWVSGTEDETYRVLVPDRSWVDFADLLWPYVATVTFDVTTVALSVGDEEEVQLTLTLSNSNTVPYDLDEGDSVELGTFIVLTSSDEGVATVTMDEDGLVTITAIAAGTTTVTAELVEDVTAERQPTPTTTIQEVTVTVT